MERRKDCRVIGTCTSGDELAQLDGRGKGEGGGGGVCENAR